MAIAVCATLSPPQKSRPGSRHSCCIHDSKYVSPAPLGTHVRQSSVSQHGEQGVQVALAREVEPRAHVPLRTRDAPRVPVTRTEGRGERQKGGANGKYKNFLMIEQETCGQITSCRIKQLPGSVGVAAVKPSPLSAAGTHWYILDPPPSHQRPPPIPPAEAITSSEVLPAGLTWG